jgi:hypothetical protein
MNLKNKDNKIIIKINNKISINNNRMVIVIYMNLN